MNVGVNRLTKALLYFLFLLFLAGAIYLLLSSKNKFGSGNLNFPEKQNTDKVVQNDENIQWEPYLNETYKYALLYPGTLTKNEYKDEGGYMHFIRFEENELSKGKGVAVGVTKRSVKEELSEVKKNILTSGEGQLISEKKFILKGLSVTRVDLEPKKDAKGEKRVVTIVNRNGITYSISTVPEQMDFVLESFTFFD